ncbi:beta/gamma crystallin domain-containing protein [Nonomuraea sp. ZG12]|uniref:beta/gamma crystallin domain-containing protein n=1 Tax=Nonomuraea sp. ZG12 TaxID=3452207 RepID=UPI003F887089
MTAALATAFTLAAPAGSAHAINNVPCGDQNFVELWGHNGNTCFANAGTWKSYDFTGSANCWWANKISTGNNDITFWDDHSTNPTYIPRRTIMTFPTVGWVCVGTLRIH